MKNTSEIRKEIYANLTQEEKRIVTSLAIKKAISKKVTIDDVARIFLAQRGEMGDCSDELKTSIEKFKELVNS